MPSFEKSSRPPKEEMSSGLPALSASEILDLPKEEFDKVAENMMVQPEKLRSLLEKTTEGKERTRTRAVPFPESKDEYAEKIARALDESVKEIEIFGTRDGVEKIKEYEGALFSAYQKIGDRSLESLESEEKRAIIELYKKLHLAKAMQVVGDLSGYQNDRSPYYKVYQALSEAREQSNDVLEKEALASVISVFWNLSREENFEQTVAFCEAYTNGSMSEEQLRARARIISKARSRAMTGSWGAKEDYSTIINSLAKRIKEMDIWRKEVDGVSGPAEVYDMPGGRGIGGQLNYRKGPRPHRDDHGSFGGENDK